MKNKKGEKHRERWSEGIISLVREERAIEAR